MKIGSIDTPQPLAPVAGDRKAGSPAAGSPATPSSATVEISPEASALAAGDGSFDAAKVERISRAIQDGTFKVNPDAIADKLIANAQELLARTYR
ncbi:MAG: hypothetical protein RJA10_212 [Pseudomonadota bacterium]|jgi:negative regulator of flagellin synthesis FlgM